MRLNIILIIEIYPCLFKKSLPIPPPSVDEMIKIYTPNLKVDVNECEQLATDYTIEEKPTFVVMKDGKKLHAVRGTDVEKLKEIIAAYK